MHCQVNEYGQPSDTEPKRSCGWGFVLVFKGKCISMDFVVALPSYEIKIRIMIIEEEAKITVMAAE